MLSFITSILLLLSSLQFLVAAPTFALDKPSVMIFSHQIIRRNANPVDPMTSSATLQKRDLLLNVVDLVHNPSSLLDSIRAALAFVTGRRAAMFEKDVIPGRGADVLRSNTALTFKGPVNNGRVTAEDKALQSKPLFLDSKKSVLPLGNNT